MLMLECELDDRGLGVEGKLTVVGGDLAGREATLRDGGLVVMMVGRYVVAPESPQDDELVRRSLLAAIRQTRMQRMSRLLPIVQVLAAALAGIAALVCWIVDARVWCAMSAIVLATVVVGSWALVMDRERRVARRFEQ